jgi:glycosyltransferase involved in cell wall biosynthesis
MKRIALVGNMNNNFFAITRYLRDMGYDARLFYRVAQEHFQPCADTYSMDYQQYCYEVNWLDKGIYNIDERKVQTDLAGFDYYIGQGDEAAAAFRSGITMDLYYPYGSDVYKYAQLPQEFLVKHRLFYYLKFRDFKRVNREIKKGTAAKSMRQVIVNAKNVLAEYTNEDFEEKLKSLEINGRYEHIPMPFIYYPEYEAGIAGINNAWANTFHETRNSNDFLILYHGRQEWTSQHNDFTPKNTHHLIIGFAKFIKKHSSIKATLVMLEYGCDIEDSKRLINDLGITDRVTWLPKVYRKELMYVISKVDVCCGEFGRSYLTFGTIVEAMLMQKAVIHYRDDRLYTYKYPELYPLLNAREPEEIENAIAYAQNNPEKLKEMGKAASGWVKEYFIKKPLEALQSLIEAADQ